MKRKIELSLLAALLVCMTSCEKQELELEFESNKFNWTEDISLCRSAAMPKYTEKEFFQNVKNKVFGIKNIYICTDSLEKVGYWNRKGQLFYEGQPYNWNEPRSGSPEYTPYVFGNDGYVKICANAKGETYYMREFRCYEQGQCLKLYWELHPQLTGLYAYACKYNGDYTLLDMDQDHLLIRIEDVPADSYYGDYTLILLEAHDIEDFPVFTEGEASYKSDFELFLEIVGENPESYVPTDGDDIEIVLSNIQRLLKHPELNLSKGQFEELLEGNYYEVMSAYEMYHPFPTETIWYCGEKEDSCMLPVNLLHTHYGNQISQLVRFDKDGILKVWAEDHTQGNVKQYGEWHEYAYDEAAHEIVFGTPFAFAFLDKGNYSIQAKCRDYVFLKGAPKKDLFPIAEASIIVLRKLTPALAAVKYNLDVTPVDYRGNN